MNQLEAKMIACYKAGLLTETDIHTIIASVTFIKTRLVTKQDFITPYGTRAYCHIIELLNKEV